MLECTSTACKCTWVRMHGVQIQGYANMECAESEQLCKLLGVQAQHAKVRACTRCANTGVCRYGPTKTAVHPHAGVHTDGCMHTAPGACLCTDARVFMCSHTHVGSRICRQNPSRIPAARCHGNQQMGSGWGRGAAHCGGGGSTSNLLPHSPKSERCAKPPQGRAPQHLPPQGRQGPPAAPQTPPCCAWGSLRPLNSRVNHSWGRGARAAANPPWPQPGLAGELRPSRRGARRAGGALFMRTDFLCRARGWGGPAAAEGEPDTVGCSGGGPTSSVGLTGL